MTGSSKTSFMIQCNAVNQIKRQTETWREKKSWSKKKRGGQRKTHDSPIRIGFPIRTRFLPQRSLFSFGTALCCLAPSQRTCGSGPCWTDDGGCPRPSPWAQSAPHPAVGPWCVWPESGPWCLGSSEKRTDGRFDGSCSWRACHRGFFLPARFRNARLQLQSSGLLTGTSGFLASADQTCLSVDPRCPSPWMAQRPAGKPVEGLFLVDCLGQIGPLLFQMDFF